MTAIGRLHHVIYDTPDPMGLARFWSAVLGHPVTYASEDFVVVVPTAESQVEALGARRLGSPDGSVWADPSGHPFCLIPRPGWAPPVTEG